MKKNGSLLCKLFVIICLILLFMNVSTTAHAQLMSTDDVAKSVVQIAIELPDREPFRTIFRDPATGDVNLKFTMGTGFLIGTDESEEFRYCATAWHVVDTTWGQDLPADMRFTPEEVNLYILRSRDDYVQVRVFQDLRTSDIAVLEIDPGHRLYGYIPLIFGDRSSYERGDRITAIGYPDAAATFSDLTIAQFTDSTTPQGSITRITTVDGVPVIQMDARVSGGHSGGPIINEDGVVIGMTIFGVGTQVNGAFIPDNIEYAVQVDELTSFLRSRNIPFLSAEDLAPEPVGDAPAPEPVEPEPVVEEIAAPVADQDQGQMILFIGIGVAVLLALVLAVVLTRGKKAAPAASAPRASTPPAPPSAPTQRAAAPATQARPNSAATPVTRAKPVASQVGIKGISGQFAGQTIVMSGNQLIIGRDPRMAQLVYPQSKDDISRKHVTIRFDEKTQKFILEDSSSNGTFLSSNEKLESGKPYYLNPGDRFYVADSKEVFELVKG